MITIDASSFRKGLERLTREARRGSREGLSDVAEEIMRLSQLEVPHDIGTLANSGQVDPDGDGYIVGYHTDYAARLHESPWYHFQKNRKGKYLEDPIKNNTDTLLDHYASRLKEVIING